jgi:ribose transport system permease protein
MNSTSNANKSAIKRFMGNQISVVFLILIVLIVFFSVIANGFFSANNLTSMLLQTAVVGIIAVGQTFVIITAGIDLSQGAVIGFSTIIAAGLMVNFNIPIFICVICSIAFGAGVGAVNGFLVAKLGLPAFIATLGTQYVVEAGALLVMSGKDIYGLPDVISDFGRGSLFGVLPYLALIMIGIAIVAHILLSKTSFGRYTYACGSNLLAARFSGINTKKTIFLVYTLSGLLSGVAGIVMMCRINAGISISGSGYEMNAICGAVIGGGSMFGGEGSILGAIIGAFIMTVLSSGLQIMGFSTYWQQFITGIVLIIAVLIDTSRRRKAQGIA